MQLDSRRIEPRRRKLLDHLELYLVLALVAAGSTAYAVTQSFTITVGQILPTANDVSVNWRNAGLAVIGAYPARSTVCATVNPTGVTPPASNDDVNTINTAIGNCAAGDILMLGSGTLPSEIPVNDSPWSASTTLPKATLTSVKVCSSPFEFRNVDEMHTGNSRASAVDHRLPRTRS